ncbi:hypothetical protein D3C75_1134330 [compost metagenome]
MAMVRFNNLDIGIVAHHLCGFFQQFQHQIDADAEVGGKDDPNLLPGGTDGVFTGVIKAGSANHHGFFMLDAESQIGQGAFRAGEVDQNIEIIDHLFQTVANGHTQCANARQFTGVGTDQA